MPDVVVIPDPYVEEPGDGHTGMIGFSYHRRHRCEVEAGIKKDSIMGNAIDESIEIGAYSLMKGPAGMKVYLWDSGDGSSAVQVFS